jgi:hypothetical protein
MVDGREGFTILVKKIHPQLVASIFLSLLKALSGDKRDLISMITLIDMHLNIDVLSLSTIKYKGSVTSLL